MIITRTPFRISFFGGGTDYPDWFTHQGGAVLATTIDKYCYLTCRFLPPFFEHRIRIVYANIENCHTVDEIKHPAAREVLRYMEIDRGVEIHHDGDLPARSGMGTSSSFTVGLLHAVYALKGQMPTKQRLASESIMIEHDMMLETVGCQDQILAAHGGLNQVTFAQDGSHNVQTLTLPKERIDLLNDHLMLFFTGVSRTSSEVASGYVEDMMAKEKQLRSIAAMVTQAVSILNNGNDINEFGLLLHEAWQAKRSISPLISNPTIDQIYDRARHAGAGGGKLLGAGGGGFMLFFVPPQFQGKVREELQDLIHVPFQFEPNGSQVIYYDHERDYSQEDTLRSSQPAMAFSELNETELKR